MSCPRSQKRKREYRLTQATQAVTNACVWNYARSTARKPSSKAKTWDAQETNVKCAKTPKRTLVASHVTGVCIVCACVFEGACCVLKLRAAYYTVHGLCAAPVVRFLQCCLRRHQPTRKRAPNVGRDCRPQELYATSFF